jgi:hypothetical protein
MTNEEGPKPKCALSLSYQELMKINPEELEELAEMGMLDTVTMARIRHVGRFFDHMCKEMPDDAVVKDVYTEEKLQSIWRETADENATDADIGLCPVTH